MPRRLYNWTFDDVATFLKHHNFIQIHIRGSHYYFQGTVKGKICLVEVPRHTDKPIKPRTLKHSIMLKSGIPVAHWMECKEKHCDEFNLKNSTAASRDS